MVNLHMAMATITIPSTRKIVPRPEPRRPVPGTVTMAAPMMTAMMPTTAKVVARRFLPACAVGVTLILGLLDFP